MVGPNYKENGRLISGEQERERERVEKIRRKSRERERGARPKHSL